MEKITPVPASVKNHIAPTITWARYAAIFSLLNLGLSLFQLVIGFMKRNPFVLFTLAAFLVSTLITLILAMHLFRYARYAKAGTEGDASTELYHSLYHLRIYFTVIGMIFMIAISLLLLMIIVGLISSLTQ